MRIIDTTTDTIYTDAQALYNEYPAEYHEMLSRIIDGTATTEEWNYLALAEPKPEEVDDALALQKALIEGAYQQRSASILSPAVPALTIKDVQIFVNLEMKGGGLDKWRESEHFWFFLVTPDQHRIKADYRLGSWEALDQAIHDAQREWEDRVRAATAKVAEAAKIVTEIEAQFEEARDTRDAAIKALSAQGVSSYRIAKITGLHQSTVGRILK